MPDVFTEFLKKDDDDDATPYVSLFCCCLALAPRGLSLVTFSPLRPAFATSNFIIAKAGVF